MKRLLGIILACLTLCGCSAMLEREYVVIEPHNEQYVEDQDSDLLTVENYAGLKNAILSLVETGLEEGVIRVYNYDGDITEDIADAAYEVARSDPLGAFAIDYLTHDYSRIVSYYELHVYITYRRTLEDIQSIVRVSGDEDLQQQVRQSLQSFDNRAIYRFSYYEDLDYNELIDELCAMDPRLEIGLPTATVSLYPETGVQRIAELTIQYSSDRESLETMRDQLDEAASQLTANILQDASNELKAYRIYRRLLAEVDFDQDTFDSINVGQTEQKGNSGTAYGALVEKLALSDGYAKAFYILCRDSDIPCMIVHGRKGGYDHFWNIIQIGEDYYHIDCASTEMEEGFQGFLLSDVDMTDYRWNADQYPACEGELSIYSIMPTQTAGEDSVVTVSPQEGLPELETQVDDQEQPEAPGEPEQTEPQEPQIQESPEIQTEAEPQPAEEPVQAPEPQEGEGEPPEE